MTMDIISYLESAVMMDSARRQKEHFPKLRHYAGDFGTLIEGEYEGQCLRKQVYNWWGLKPTNVEAKRLFAPRVGMLLEKQFIEWLRMFPDQLALATQATVFAKPPELEFPIKGRIDLIVYDKATEKRTMYEIKTVHAKAMNNRKFGMKYNGPKTSYILQLSFYKDHFRNVPIDEYKILVFSREDFNRREFTMGEDFHPINTMDYRCFQVVEKYLKAKELPPKTFPASIEKYPCAWCDFRTRCWEFDMDSRNAVDEEEIWNK
jgi:hypothetical protein